MSVPHPVENFQDLHNHKKKNTEKKTNEIECVLFLYAIYFFLSIHSPLLFAIFFLLGSKL